MLQNVKDLGGIPGPRRFHVQLRLGAKTLSTHPAATEALVPRARAPPQEAAKQQNSGKQL